MKQTFYLQLLNQWLFSHGSDSLIRKNMWCVTNINVPLLSHYQILQEWLRTHISFSCKLHVWTLILQCVSNNEFQSNSVCDHIIFLCSIKGRSHILSLILSQWIMHVCKKVTLKIINFQTLVQRAVEKASKWTLVFNEYINISKIIQRKSSKASHLRSWNHEMDLCNIL